MNFPRSQVTHTISLTPEGGQSCIEIDLTFPPMFDREEEFKALLQVLDQLVVGYIPMTPVPEPPTIWDRLMRD